jgi:hypothetical protein
MGHKLWAVAGFEYSLSARLLPIDRTRTPEGWAVPIRQTYTPLIAAPRARAAQGFSRASRDGPGPLVKVWVFFDVFFHFFSFSFFFFFLVFFV